MGTIKAFDLEQLLQKTNIKTFVETGTLYGESVDHALKFPFEKIYSIEIDNNLAVRAIQKYQHQPNVIILNGDSASVIEALCKTLKTDTLFWLDAHFPGADAGSAPYDADIPFEKKMPMCHELQSIITRLNTYKDVIICDDLWIYEEGPFESGDFDVHCRNHKQNMTRESLRGPVTLNQMLQPFENTHKITRIYKNNGYIALIPK